MQAQLVKPKTVTLSIKHHFKVPPLQVFNAWLDPVNAGKWLFATPGGEMTKVEMDVRVGGYYSLVEQRDGQDIDHHGEYLAIDRPRYLVFTFGVDATSMTRVTLNIMEAGDGCDLTLTHDGVWADYEDQTRKGWSTILENLAQSLISDKAA